MNFVIKRSAPLKNLNFVILDGLRGIAAVYVVINHCRGNLVMGGSKYAESVPVEKWDLLTKLYYTSLQGTALGAEFVIFFFVLSGFSIAHSLMKSPETGGFYVRRLIRLYPPYIAALIYAGIAFFLVLNFAPRQIPETETIPVYHNLEYILSNLVYIPKGAFIPQFWSLTYEVLFYIIIALLFTRNLKWYYILSVIGFVIGVGLNWKELAGQSIIEKFVFDYNIFFVAGIALYMNYEKISSLLVFRKLNFWMSVIVIFAATAGVKILMGESNRFTPLMAAALSVLMIVNFLYYKIDNKVLRFLGSMSYTIYITHFASIYLFMIILDKMGFPFHNEITQPYIWPVGVVFALLAAIPFYYIAELPTRNILKRMRGEKTVPSEVAAQTVKL